MNSSGFLPTHMFCSLELREICFGESDIHFGSFTEKEIFRELHGNFISCINQIRNNWVFSWGCSSAFLFLLLVLLK